MVRDLTNLPHRLVHSATGLSGTQECVVKIMVGKKTVAKTLKAPKTPDPTWDHYVFMYDLLHCISPAVSLPPTKSILKLARMKASVPSMLCSSFLFDGSQKRSYWYARRLPCGKNLQPGSPQKGEAHYHW
jgi:hypothetical protein